MHEDKNGARLDQMQAMINELRRDLEGFKKDQIDNFSAQLSVLKKMFENLEQKQNNLSAKFWSSVVINLFFIFVLAVYLGLK